MNSDAFKTELLFKQINSERIMLELAGLRVIYRLLKLRQSVEFYKLVRSNAHLDINLFVEAKHRATYDHIIRAQDSHWIITLCDYSNFELQLLFSNLNTLYQLTEGDIDPLVNFNTTQS